MEVLILPSCKNDRLARELSEILGVRQISLDSPEVIHEHMAVIDCGPEQYPFEVPEICRLDILKVAEVASKIGAERSIEGFSGVISRILGEWCR